MVTAPPVPASAEPAAGSHVEVFNARAGWRLGFLGQSAEWGTVLRFQNSSESTVLHMPLDFDTGSDGHATCVGVCIVWALSPMLEVGVTLTNELTST